MMARLALWRLFFITAVTLCLDCSNPPNLAAVKDIGDPVNRNPALSPSTRLRPSLRIHVPESRKVNTDCDVNTALVT